MPDTGINWDDTWTEIDAAIVLTQGGTIADVSAEIDLDGKIACRVSVDVDYSNHAKATDGLTVSILEDINGTDFEATTDVPWAIPVPFTQNGTNRMPIRINPADVNKFKIGLDWGNTTGSSVATVATKVLYGTLPVAS